MRAIKLFIVLLLVLLVAAPVALTLAVVETKPTLTSSSPPDTQDAVRAKRLLRKSLKMLSVRGEAKTLVASAVEIRSLLSVAARGFPGARTDTAVDGNRMRVQASLPLPGLRGHGFVNARFDMSAPDGAEPSALLTLGRIALSGGTLLWLARTATDLALDRGDADRALAGIESVTIDKDALHVKWLPPDNLKQNLKGLVAKLTGYRDELHLLGDPAVIGRYYSRLMEVDASTRNASLADYARPAFALAVQRSEASSAHDENQSAILALAMYLGDIRLERLIGRVRSGELADAHFRNGGASLAGRQDLMLHFIISSALQIIAQSGITHGIGEFKELLDSARGGSGFSFADLAADRAGTRFAEVATDPDTATGLQQAMATAQEDTFFPDIAGLPENLTQERFEAQFGSVEAPAYAAMVATIDRRIESLQAYR